MVTAPVQVRTRIVMGLPFSLHLRSSEAAGVDAAADRAWTELEAADRIFSTYRPDSDISRLARGEAAVAELDPVVPEVLELAERARSMTGGWFDVNGAGHLDPSGLVKGWAAHRAAQAIRMDGTDRYLNAGGDIELSALDPDDPWRIGIEHPDDPSGLLTVFCLTSGAVATSGRAHRGDHLWDPRSGRPARNVLQTTVIGPSLMWADVLATAAAVAGPDLLDRTGWPPGYEVLFARPGGTVTATSGVADLVAPDAPELRISGWL